MCVCLTDKTAEDISTKLGR